MTLHPSFLGTWLLPLNLIAASGICAAQAPQTSPPADSSSTFKKKDEGADQAKSVTVVQVVGSTDYDPRRDDTAAKVVISSAEILRYGDSMVTDVLKRVPGITVRGTSDVRMRGLGSGYTQILLNGERTPSGFSIDQIHPSSIEKIEVVRTASAEFSTQSIAGTINIILKKTVKPATVELKVGAAGGELSHWVNSYFQGSDRKEDLSYSLNISTSRQDFVRYTDATELSHQRDIVATLYRFHNKDEGHVVGINAAPRGVLKLDSGSTIISQSFFTLNSVAVSGRTPVESLIGEQYPYDYKLGRNQFRTVTGRSDLTINHQPSGWAKFEAKVGVNVGSTKGEVHQAGITDKVILDRNANSSSDNSGLSSTGKLVSLPMGGQTASLGWETSVSRRADERIEIEHVASQQYPGKLDEEFDASIRRIALFIQDDWSFDKELSMYAGLRWEEIGIASKGSDFSTIRQSSRIASPLFQALYKFPSKDQVRVGVSRTYKAPSLTSLIPRKVKALYNSPTEPDYIGNPSLKPEIALGIDASFEHYWSTDTLFSANASVRKLDDVIRRTIFLKDGRWISTEKNAEKALVHSLEFEVKAALRQFFATAPAVQLRASISKNWSSLRSVPGPNNRLDQQIPLSATISVDYASSTGKLKIGSSFAFSSGAPTRITEQLYSYAGVQRDLSGYALFQISAKSHLRISASNILETDEKSAMRYVQDNNDTSRSQVTSTARLVRVMFETRL